MNPLLQKYWPRSKPVQILSIANAAFGVVLVFLMFTSPSLELPTTQDGDIQALTVPDLQQASQGGNLKAIEDRPLFHASRKPRAVISQPTQQPVAQVAPTTPGQLYKLTGVIDSPSGQRFAYVLQIAGNETIKVKVGDNLGAWRVTDLTRGTMTLDREGQSFSLSLTR